MEVRLLLFAGGLMPYLLLVLLPTLAITGWAAWKVRSTYSRWSQVDSGISMSAFDFARYLLNAQGLNDVRIEADWTSVVEAVLAEHGQIDVLINNAGIFRIGPLVMTTEEEYRQVIDINQIGVFLGMRAVVPHMVGREQGSGRLVVFGRSNVDPDRYFRRTPDGWEQRTVSRAS